MKFHKNLILKIGLSALLLIAMQGCSSHANYPVTRMVGWAFAQHAPWEVLELSAEFEDQNFSLYNSTTHMLIKAIESKNCTSVSARFRRNYKR
jgi:hypothetical protein